MSRNTLQYKITENENNVIQAASTRNAYTLSLILIFKTQYINPYPTAFPHGNGMVLHFYQQQESSTTKTVHKVINKDLKRMY